MIYVDASIVLAELLAEDRQPSPSLWEETLWSSRLLEYETWTRINTRGLGRTRGEAVQQLLGLISLIELSPLALGRALEPFPVPVRTLDALHLASIAFLHEQRIEVAVATYDQRLAAAAEAMGFSVHQV